MASATARCGSRCLLASVLQYASTFASALRAEAPPCLSTPGGF